MNSLYAVRSHRKVIYALYMSIVMLIALATFLLIHKTTLEEIVQTKELVVVTRNSPTTYYYDYDSYGGLEYDLVHEFARYLGVGVKFKVVDTPNEALVLLQKDEAHIAAAGLSKIPQRDQHYRSSTPYQHIQQNVVCKYGEKCPKDLADLIQFTPLVIEESPYEEHLKELQLSYPDLKWKSVENHSIEDILKMVAEGETICTIADSNIIAINRRYYPELKTAFVLKLVQPLSWYFRKSSYKLQAKADEWLQEFKAEGKLEKLLEKHYASVEQYDYIDSKYFKKQLKKRLPRYINYFIRAAKKYDLDTIDLVALAYQESHWNPKAVSPTGVKGIMMLTKATADFVGIKDRKDYKQSIEGGAKYMAYMLEQIPKEVHAADKLNFAMAAYNVGIGHLMDARTLAVKFGKDPNSWYDIKKILPLLTKRKYFKYLKYGYARGYEPVRYVTNIIHYRDMLREHFKKRICRVPRSVLQKRGLTSYLPTFLGIDSRLLKNR
jgi:membrane-bound lytic murein transglycosylase F